MEPKDQSQDKYYVPAVESALDIIEELASSVTPRSISDLAVAVGKTPGRLFRILTTLERRGYVTKSPATGHYEITLRLLHLAHQTSPMRRLVPVAGPLMQKLADEIGQSCHLSVLEGGQMIVVHEVPSPDPIRLVIDVGARHPILDTLSGRVVLAGMAPEARDVLIETDDALRLLSTKAKTTLRTELEEVSQRGYATRHSGLHTGVDDFSVAIGRLAHQPIAALTVTALEQVGKKHQVSTIIDRLLKTGKEINVALGQMLAEDQQAEQQPEQQPEQKDA